MSVKEAPAAPRPKFPPVVLPSNLIRSPRKSSPVVENAREVLKKIWNWVLVGDRPEGVTFEFALASRWLLIAGIVAIVACVAYFLKWSIERELIGPQARVAISILVGAGMLVGGLRLLGRKYHLMGQGLMGGGVVTLYFSMYAAGPLYSVLPTPAVFALMILVTVTAGLLAVRTDSMLFAIIGILGGFITPVLLRTPELNLPVLYGYTLLLSIGILGMAYYKQWRLLNYIGFVCTYVLVLGSMSAYFSATRLTLDIWADMHQPTRAQNLLGGVNHVVHVQHDQRQSIFGHRGGVDVGHLAQAGRHRADHQIAFAQESVHDKPIRLAPAGDHHDRVTRRRRLAFVVLQHLSRADQADVHVVGGDVLLTLDLLDVVGIDVQAVVDSVEREGVSFAVDLHQ